MNRSHRRIAILRGKRGGAFDPNQYWLEGAARTRLARQVRVNLRANHPVVLHTPRWSRAQQFLDDLATDLALGEPAIEARTLNLVPLRGLTAHQAWAWLVAAVAEFCQGSLEEGPAWQAVSRHGFRAVIGEQLARAEDGPRRCLLLHGLEAVPIEALSDLLAVFRDHVARFGASRKFNLLFAGSVDGPAEPGTLGVSALAAAVVGAEPVDLDAEDPAPAAVAVAVGGPPRVAAELGLGSLRASRFELRDYAPREAIEVLVEHFGPLEPHRLASVVGVVGGVPALLDVLGTGAESRLSELLVDRDQIWRALGPLADEVRSALDIANADSRLSHRLERLARLGPLPAEPERDGPLLRAGLVRERALPDGPHSEVRAPWFADLVMAL